MALKVISMISILATILPAVFTQTCLPGFNCKPPLCRCWNDRDAPGGFETRDIPQMIVVSFEYGINSGNLHYYTQLLDGIVNPNNCKVRASFYPTGKYTNFDLARRLYDGGHEFGVSTVDWNRPGSAIQWAGNFSVVKAKLMEVGIPRGSIIGSRGPSLDFGGNDEVSAARMVGLEYDTSCGTVRFDSGNFLWPYTYDYIYGAPQCTVGTPVTKSFPGMWQFMIADLQFQGHKCATPSSCSDFIKSPKNASDMFYNAFTQHYNQETRPPFFVVIDPAWLTSPHRAEGTRQFLQLVGAAFQDVWIVTAQQALAWMKNPVKASKVAQFQPWSC